MLQCQPIRLNINYLELVWNSAAFVANTAWTSINCNVNQWIVHSMCMLHGVELSLI